MKPVSILAAKDSIVLDTHRPPAAMARPSVFVGILSIWVVLLTILSAYMVLSGKYILVKTDEKLDMVAESMLQESDGNGERHTEIDRLFHLKRSPNLHMVERHGSSLGFQAELKKILAIDESNPRAAFEQVVALSSLLPKITNISRMKTPSPETFRNYIAPVGLPVVFTDMLEGQMLGTWTWDYVRSKWGDQVYSNIRQGNFSTKTSKSGKHTVNRVSVRLRDFIDVVTGKRKPTEKERGLYIAKKRVIPVEALEAEFYYPPFYPGPHKNCYLEPTGWYVIQSIDTIVSYQYNRFI